MRIYLLGILSLVLLSSCAVNRKVKYDGVKLDLTGIKTKNIDLALLDHREAVIDGSRKPDFVGYMVSGAGIHWPMGTLSKNNLMDDLSNNLVNSLDKYNVKVTNVITKWQDDEKTIKSKLLALNGDIKIFFVFNQLNTNGYGIQFLYYNINVYIYNKSGELLKHKVIVGKDKLGGNIAFGPCSFETYMPKSMSKLFEDILNDKEILETINKDLI
ncbi:hypothetical protein [Flavobacterium praedii]|uniref:hypothetical protein n=1 Tax=Flavobacterium praedii TaxID=3002900 RepID=UPI002481F3C2|nr:hypothetical protein [Flavobacterium praedii]